MSHTLASQLNRFELDPETFELAKSLLHTAQLKTALGSGHELGQGVTGLPAICAYIACKQRHSSEVDLKTAQAASCIRSLIFKKTLEIVETVLKTSPTQNGNDAPSVLESSSEIAYASLLQRHNFRKNTDILLSSLMDVEKALLTSGELRSAELKLLKDSKLLRYAVFGWTCAVYKAQNVSHPLLKKKYSLQDDSYDDLVTLMNSACSHVSDQIREQRTRLRQQEKARSSSTLPTPTPSPTKSSASSSRFSSPTKSALKRKSTFTPVDQPTPTKRKVVFTERAEDDDDHDIVDAALETPSKKMKLMFLKPPKSNGFSTPRASSSRVTLDRIEESEDPMQVDPPSFVAPALPPPVRLNPDVPLSTPRLTRQSSSPTKLTPTAKSKSPYSSFIEDENLPSVRVRPVFLDHRQWFCRDPKIERELRKAEEIRKKLRETYGESPIEKYRPVNVE